MMPAPAGMERMRHFPVRGPARISCVRLALKRGLELITGAIARLNIFRMMSAGRLAWEGFKEAAAFRCLMAALNRFLIRRMIRL
jgi:hypothetical protein